MAIGFSSPAKDFEDAHIDLNKELTSHPQSTYYARISGSTYSEDGIDDGDILVIDKSLSAKNGSIAVCVLDGEFTIKKIFLHDPTNTQMQTLNDNKAIYTNKIINANRQSASYNILETPPLWLTPVNWPQKNGNIIKVNEPNDFTIWGIITYVIKKV